VPLCRNQSTNPKKEIKTKHYVDAETFRKFEEMCKNQDTSSGKEIKTFLELPIDELDRVVRTLKAENDEYEYIQTLVATKVHEHELDIIKPADSVRKLLKRPEITFQPFQRPDVLVCTAGYGYSGLGGAGWPRRKGIKLW
jgi:hypothetical protein